MVVPHPEIDPHALLTRPPLPLLTVRLACVKHAASVRSEPGSNSQVHQSPIRPKPNQKTNELDPNFLKLFSRATRRRSDTQKLSKHLSHISKTHQQTPENIRENPDHMIQIHPKHQPIAIIHLPSQVNKKRAQQAPPTYPFHS